jgi:hypothetical protein
MNKDKTRLYGCNRNRSLLLLLAVIASFSAVLAQIGLGGKYATNIKWVCQDENINANFISEYYKLLQKGGQDTEIQESDWLIVTAGITRDNTLEISELMAWDEESDVIENLDMDVVNQLLDPIKQSLLSRKYAWDDYDTRLDPSWVGPRPIANVFDERSFKIIHDISWWTYRGYDLASTMRWVIRDKNNFVGLTLEPGFTDIGFPGVLSKTVNFNVATEIVKIFYTLPGQMGFSTGNIHSLEGSNGAGMKFDNNRFGGLISYQDISKSFKLERIYDLDNSVFLKSAGLIYISNTFSTPGIVKDLKEKNIPGVSKRNVWPTGSLRVKVGVGYTELTYGSIDSSGHFNEIDRLDFQESIRFICRLEYATDLDKGKNNMLYAALQVNVNRYFEKASQFQVSWGVKPWLRLQITLAQVDKVEFNTSGSDSYEWKPGFMIMPSVAIHL